MDKGYIGQALFKNLFLNGIQLVTKVKNNMKTDILLFMTNEEHGQEDLYRLLVGFTAFFSYQLVLG